MVHPVPIRFGDLTVLEFQVDHWVNQTHRSGPTYNVIVSILALTSLKFLSEREGQKACKSTQG